MKCATSSMHSILSQHEEIYIPNGEIHFFCIDDVVQHPDFFNFRGSRRGPHYEQNFDRNLAWYKSFFSGAEEDQWIGDHSTVYLSAPEAAGRIRDLLPEVKILFMLRNPVDRTYSHYWHRVRTGRAVFPFEQELEHGPSVLHLRSFYKPQLERYFGLFPREQLKAVVFERFAEDTQQVVDEVCSFLGLSTTVDVQDAESHVNVSRVPQWHRLQLVLNYAMKGLWSRYNSHLPGKAEEEEKPLPTRMIRSVLSRLRNRNLRKESYPPMASETRRELEQIYARKNKGLQKMVACDLGDYWGNTFQV